MVRDEAKARRDEIDGLSGTNSRLQQEVLSLTLKLSQYEATLSQTAESKDQIAHTSANKISQLERQLSETKADLERKVSETTQFQSMMKLMRTQNARLKDLRTRLGRYETVTDDPASEGGCKDLDDS